MKRVLLLLAAALAARLLTFALFDPIGPMLAGDAPTFIHPTPGFQPPLYPLLVTTFGWPLIPWLQSGLAIIVGLFTLHRLPKYGFPTALALVTLPWFIVTEWMVRTEPLVLALLWLAVLLLAFPRSRWDGAVAGVLLWLAILTRDSFLLLPLALLPMAWWAGKAAFRRTFLAAACALMLTAPFLPISQGRLGINLWIGTWERDSSWLVTGLSNGTFPDAAFASPAQRPELEQAVRTRDDATLFNAAEQRIRSDPGFVLTSWAVRYPRLWLGTRTDQAQLRLASGSVPWTMVKLAAFGLNLLVIVLAIWGMLRTKSPLMLGPILYVGLLYIPFHNSETRYSLPVLPFLLWFAMAGAEGALRQCKRLTRRSARGPTPHEGHRSAPSPAPPAAAT